MKDESKVDEVNEIMYTICEALRNVSMNLYSFFPEKMTQVFESLGLEAYDEYLEDGKLEELRSEKVTYNITKKAPILFEKFEVE
jgi:methionyl-tRNA synthetase